MIIRRATQVVAGTTMPRSATRWLPRAWPEGPREAGIGQRRGCFDRTTVLLGRRHPATGSHLPSEDTVPPCAVAPFASSPFAHPLPQSHRRASGDLFSASLATSISPDPGIAGGSGEARKDWCRVIDASPRQHPMHPRRHPSFPHPRTGQATFYTREKAAASPFWS